MDGSIEERIAALAADQHGILSHAQLVAAGMSARQIRSRREDGRLCVRHRGVYILGHLRGRLEPLRAAEMAAVLASGGGALVSHRNAAGLRGIAPSPARTAAVHVVLPAGRTPARRSGIVAHRAADLTPADATTVDGIPTTAPLRTLADLATVMAVRELEAAVAQAERLGLVSDGELRDLVVRRRGRPGAGPLREVILRDGGAALTRSEVEAQFRDLVRGTGLPRPRLNARVLGYELDCYWPEEELAVEVDGFEYHGSRRSFAADRRRDAELLASAGIRVLRFTWEQIVHEPKKTLVTLARALSRGGTG